MVKKKNHASKIMFISENNMLFFILLFSKYVYHFLPSLNRNVHKKSGFSY